MKLKHFTTIVLFAAALFLGCPAHSQMYDGSAYAFPVPDYVGPMLSSSILQSSIDAAKTKKSTPTAKSKKTTRKTTSPAQKTATAAERAKLVFTPSPAVTRRVNESFARQLAPSDTKKQEQFLKLLNSGQLQREYDQLVRQVGLSNRNVADAATAYLVACWQIVHGQNNGNRTATQAQRRKMENALAQNAKIRAMDNAKKQEFAQNLQMLTILAIVAYRENQRTSNTKNQQQLKQNLIRANRKFGVDLEKLKLTDRGLV